MLEFLPYIMVGAVLMLTSSPVFFLVCLALNELLNKALKHYIKQPRPIDCPIFLKKSYGMPSGHSQVAGFASAFIWRDATYIQRVALVLATLATMAQRVISRCHSIPQVAVGAVLGITFGTFCYTLLYRYKILHFRV
jgi:hypothetical protein